MNHTKLRALRRGRRKAGIRKRVIGRPDQPRLTVFRSLNHMYAQVVDDLAGHTLIAASTCEKAIDASPTGNRDAAAAVGKLLAERAKEAGISRVVFDRNGFKYHGRVKALAEGAREGGLKF